MKKALLLFLPGLLLAACTKESTKTIEDELNPPIGETPELTLLSVSSTSVVQYADSLVFTVQYLDGDGDLGTSDPDATPLELVDQRDPDQLIFGYHLPPLAPAGSEIAIQGELRVVLQNTILLDPDSESETTTFTLRLQDRAGNWSNEVETEEITIRRE